MIWRVGDKRIELSRPVVMGVLNVTPDSFSDGGAYRDPLAAVARAEQMLDEGAAIVDVGPESTRPGSEAVPAGEQVRRAVTVISELHQRHPAAVISIDTRDSAVAAAALAAGASLINDISALRDDSEMADLAHHTRAGVVLMHMQGTPRTMQACPQYADVVAEVADFLRERAAWAEANGIERERVAVDPGIGFGKTAEHNLALLSGVAAIVALGYPVVVGASRKSFIGTLLGEPDPSRRLAGSLACAAAAVLGGAQVLRVHDVAATSSLAALLEATRPRAILPRVG